MRARLLLLGIWAACFVEPIIGQNPSVPDESSRQYLFLVDTSFSMARQKQAVVQTISELIFTGLNGQMHPGDSFAIWTFNEDVETRRFAPHIWVTEQSQVLAQRAGQFLRSLRYEKQTRMEKAMAEIRNAIQTSKALTVILVTDGDTRISGTPFDRRINLLYSERGRNLRKIRRPFLTTLVTRDGKFLASVVSAAGEPIKIPETRPPLQTMPSVVSSARPEPPAVKPSTPQAETIITPSPPKETSVSQTNQPASDSIPPATAKAPLVSGGSEPSNPTVIQAAPANSVPSPDAASPAKAKIEMSPPAVESGPVKTEATAVATPTARTESGPPPKETTKAVQPSSDLASVKPEKENPGERIRDSTSEVSQLPTDDRAALATSAGTSHPQGYLVLGVALLLLALGLVFWYLRNSKPQSRPSLISRSLDNRKK